MFCSAVLQFSSNIHCGSSNELELPTHRVAQCVSRAGGMAQHGTAGGTRHAASRHSKMDWVKRAGDLLESADQRVAISLSGIVYNFQM